MLVRTDAAGATREFAAHLHERGVGFSIGAIFAPLDVHTALALLPAAAWTPAYQARKPRAAEDGVQIQLRDGGTGRRGHRPGRSVRVPARHPADPAPRTPTPRRAAAHHRRRRDADHRLPSPTLSRADPGASSPSWNCGIAATPAAKALVIVPLARWSAAGLRNDQRCRRCTRGRHCRDTIGDRRLDALTGR